MVKINDLEVEDFCKNCGKERENADNQHLNPVKDKSCVFSNSELLSEDAFNLDHSNMP